MQFALQIYTNERYQGNYPESKDQISVLWIVMCLSELSCSWRLESFGTHWHPLEVVASNMSRSICVWSVHSNRPYKQRSERFHSNPISSRPRVQTPVTARCSGSPSPGMTAFLLASSQWKPSWPWSSIRSRGTTQRHLCRRRQQVTWIDTSG